MKLSRLFNLACILFGGCIAVYANANESQNTYILIAGIVLLMFGIYRLSRGIPSKLNQKQNDTFVKTEDDKN